MDSKTVKKNWTIISLGGAIIVPDQIDVQFLKKFCRFIIAETKRGHNFVIVCGGGKTNRIYNAASRELGKPKNVDLDWVGIRTISLNAELVRIGFGATAYPKVVFSPKEMARTPRESILVAGADLPGRSSDYDAVEWAKRFGATSILNLSNITHVYTGDPRKDAKAKPLTDMAWRDFQKIVGTKWSARLSSPFDPIATKKASKLGLTVGVLHGHNLKNIKQAILGKTFVGTVLHP